MDDFIGLLWNVHRAGGEDNSLLCSDLTQNYNQTPGCNNVSLKTLSLFPEVPIWTSIPSVMQHSLDGMPFTFNYTFNDYTIVNLHKYGHTKSRSVCFIYWYSIIEIYTQYHLSLYTVCERHQLRTASLLLRNLFIVY